MNKKYTIAIVFVLLAISLACTLSTKKHPTSPKENLASTKEPQKGGIQIILLADVPGTLIVTDATMNEARQIIESRLIGLGINDAEVVHDADRRIAVTLPAMTNAEQVINVLRQTALLEFVDMSSLTYEQALAYQNAGTLIVTDLYQTGAISTTQQVWHTVMSGADIETASVSQQSGRYSIAFETTSDGAQKFSDFTSQHIGKVLAIVLDKKIISAPTINDAITDGKGVISGNFTADSANALAVQLRYGALPVPLKVVETNVIYPGP